MQADSRCVVEEDAGCTKADKVDKTSKFFCIHFARGMCARGPECQYFHRVPTLQDDAVAGQLHDCFGRERHANHRDDMDGVGSFNNPSRTLYVGGILKSTYRNQEEVEAALWKHFGEWGEVEHINFVPRLSIAFVRFRLRTNCEFAKEAMQNQALDGEECLNLKWAYDDPNPKAQDAIKYVHPAVRRPPVRPPLRPRTSIRSDSFGSAGSSLPSTPPQPTTGAPTWTPPTS